MKQRRQNAAFSIRVTRRYVLSLGAVVAAAWTGASGCGQEPRDLLLGEDVGREAGVAARYGKGGLLELPCRAPRSPRVGHQRHGHQRPEPQQGGGLILHPVDHQQEELHPGALGGGRRRTRLHLERARGEGQAQDAGRLVRGRVFSASWRSEISVRGCLSSRMGGKGEGYVAQENGRQSA